MRRMLKYVRKKTPTWIEIWLPLKASKEDAAWLDPIVRSLETGERRLANSPASLGDAWTPDCLRPEKFDDYQLGRNALPDAGKIEQDYLDECEAFLSTLDTDNHFQRLLQRSLVEPSVKELRPIIVWEHKEAEVAKYWGMFGIPLRYFNGHVYRIWPNFDLLAAPYVTQMSADAFVAECARYTALERLRLRRVEAQRDSLLLMMIAGVFLWALTR